MNRVPPLIVAVLLLALTGCSLAPAQLPDAGASDAPTPTPTPAPTAVVDVPRTSSAVPPVVDPVAPVRVQVPSASIDMSIRPVGIEDGGFMELPPEPTVAGWYRFGAYPAEGAGNTVLAAHVDSRVYGIGPLSNLRNLAAGTEVQVESEDGGMTRYAVESVTYYPRSQLPTEQLFVRDGAPALVLITCGGSFDAATRSYSDNVVAIARPIA
ncbi:class F sortase [Microbacterium lacus]|uniref:class F sortase n=1 Tax=Microbacterium lacus TaxID=415217 RepID=UPI000C2C5045|nr:class F sortase [Microbacterium lacus]